MLTPALSMTVPVITLLPECGDFTKTVQPYLPELYALPQKVFERIDDLNALKELYLSTNPLIAALAFVLFLAPVVLIVSEVNKNYSQVDRLWSIVPAILIGHYTMWAHLMGLPTQRLNHVMALSMLWGIRLTYNYWRKGGYQIGTEDYRWAIVKDYTGPTVMFIFNVTFISFGQCMLLWLITTPTYILLLSGRIIGDELTTYDSAFSKIMFFLVIIEFFADQQQWNFHQAKAKYRESAKVPQEYRYTQAQLDRGFNTSGLWAYSRHPNFAAEQAFWVCLYQWSCCESFTFMNWTFAGAMSYLLLFQASTWLTELITSGKYPEYKLYQLRVGKFLPKTRTKSMDDPKTEKEKKAMGINEEKEKAIKETAAKLTKSGRTSKKVKRGNASSSAAYGQ
ncbi:DUF1295-domain-containing protein [Lojkania enalia]|uniref:DUF1295-domain-containing protein n=1 Tax=Lojkania enalia TaxID=147567 RepID=A0A9P4N6M4_9PLEO|nr:DUF1295-domain-containing protein [Didymosphaeria enalia]